MALLLVANKVMTGYPNSVVLESGQIIIGRLTNNHLVLSDGAVEPIHAMIEIDPETGVSSVIDMASEIGVLLNGRRIDVSANIKVGDKLSIGDATIEVQTAADATAAKNDSKDGGADARGEDGKAQPGRVSNGRVLFTAEKDRRTGSTLEVVAFWDQSILDVRHYGGEQIAGDEPRSNKVILGNEHDGELIGVGPKANTRNLKLADVKGSKAVVYLNDEMRARIRRGARFEQMKGPAEVQLSANDMALIQHGTISYFLTRVSLPNPVLRKIDDLDGKPVIFAYASALYLILALLIGIANANNPPQENADDEAWATQFTVRTPTPKPTDKAEPPAPKPTVAIKTPAPEKKSTPPPKPKPTEPPKPVGTPKPVPPTNVQRATPKPEAPAKNQGPVTGEKPKTKDPFLGPQNKGNAGNSGGPKGGTSGAFAGQRQGNDKNSMMGVEGGKKDELGGLNLDALGSDIGKTINAEGAGKIAIGVKANGGGLGGGSGSGKRGSMGLGGIGEGNSISAGGPGDALKGLGAGGFGSGGNGAGGRRDSGGGGKIRVGSVSAPAGDSVLEGNLSKEEIEAVIRANLAKIKACYERRLQAKRGLQGRVMSKFVISPDGRVSTASISQSDLGDGPTETCIASEIKRWKFPLPRGGGQVSVTYPFVFTPST
jgi:TonB family protein